MRQFRMPIEHTKSLSKFKTQIGTILRELKEFDEKEKYEAFSYLQGYISAKRLRKKRNSKRIKVQTKPPLVKKQRYKCRECNYSDSSRKEFYKHIENHEGFSLSCRKCRDTFNNHLLFDWHVKFRCRTRILRKTVLFPCNECPQKFFSKQNLKRHIDGHKRNNCTYCDQVITNRKHLIQHLLDVHSIKLERAIYKCRDCDKRFVKRRSLYYHKKQHYADKFVCLDCGLVCDNEENMSNHQRDHDVQKNFTCPKCNQKFQRRQQYLFHMKRHDSYKCVTCNETFASKMKMLFHKQQGHTVEGLNPKFSCPDCGKEFFQKNKLMFHMRKHTDDKPTLNCQYCDKTFQSPYAYYKHSTTASHEKSCPETSVFICENCGGQFKKKYLLEQHNIRVHNNNKEYISCDFCSYKTKNRANMNRHKDTHVNGKTFICEQCGKDFNNVSSLKGHISYIHTQNKQHQCNKCNKTFKRNSELVRHQGTHSDDRPHICKLCGQSYKRSTHLRRHEKSSHKIVAPPRTNQRLQIEPDGTVVPISPTLRVDQTSTSFVGVPTTAVPFLSVVESEPLALVKRKDHVDSSDRTFTSEPQPEITYFDNINTSTGTCDSQNFEEEDIILDMSMMSNNNETQYFLNSQYTNDQLIQEYIGQDNLQFVETHVTGYNNVAPSSNRYVLNNIFNFIDSHQYYEN